MTASIPILHTSNFIVLDPTKFSFVGSIPEEMLKNVPSDNIVVNEYWKKPTFGVRPMPEDLWMALKEGNKPQKGGNKKSKVGSSEPAATPKKNIKKAAWKPRSPNPIQEASESCTHLDLQERVTVRNDTNDTVATS